MTTPEGKNRAYMLARVRTLGGLARKVTWQGRAGAPDWLIMINGRTVWIELKAPGEKPRLAQVVEFQLLKRFGGIDVIVCDSPESIDTALQRCLGTGPT